VPIIAQKLSRGEILEKVWGRPVEVSPLRNLVEAGQYKAIAFNPKFGFDVPLPTKLIGNPAYYKIEYKGQKISLGDIPHVEMLELDFWGRFGDSLDEMVYEAICQVWHDHAEAHCNTIMQGGPQAWETEYYACKANKLYMLAYWWVIVDYRRRKRRLFLNPIQRKFWTNRGSVCQPEPYIDIVLKARKQGLSTIILADFGHDVMFQPFTRAVCLTHKMDASKEMRRRFSDSIRRLPAFLRPATVTDSAAEMRFRVTSFGDELDSGFYIDSARAIESGRATDVDRLHLSEYAYYQDPEMTSAALFEAMREGGRICIESTPNGDNDFAVKFRLGDPESLKSLLHNQHAAAGDIYRSHFFRWFDDPRYRVAITREFNPSEEERLLTRAHGLTPSQINFRRRRMARYTAEGGRYTFLKDFPEDKRTCFILSAGGHVFSIEKIEEQRLLIMAMPGPAIIVPKRGIGRAKRWYPAEKGRWYIAGCDTSEGEQGGNPSGAIIIDGVLGEQVADVHGIFTPYELAYESAELCAEYNNALLIVERNNHGAAVLAELLHHICYPNVYWHVPFAATKKTTAPMKPGWPTGVGKAEAVGSLREGLESEEIGMVVNDIDFLDECLTYVSDRTAFGNLKTHAQPGCLDDRVMKNAIAWHVRKLVLLGRVPFDMAPKIITLATPGDDNRIHRVGMASSY